jgi:hypothetical protein
MSKTISNEDLENHTDEMSDKVNILTRVILDDFQQFIDRHLKGVDPIISGFILHELSQYCFTTCMINGRNMANKAAENGAYIDIQGLLDSYKKLFNDGTDKMYKHYVQKRIN